MSVHVINGGLPDAPAGFWPDGPPLPATRLDVDEERRERAALLVLAIGRYYTPDELVAGVPADITAAFRDDLERDEALAHVDLLLEVLSPRPRPTRRAEVRR